MGVHVQENTLWMNLKKLAELFDMDIATINYHLNAIFESGELDRATSAQKIQVMQQEGRRRIGRSINFYNLDAILAIAYRAHSGQATRIRQWMTSVLRQFILQGFVQEEHYPKEGH